MKILLVQVAFLGDVILATPAIAAIRKIYPEAEIYTLTTPIASKLLEHDPLIAGRLTYDKRKTEKGLSGILRKAKELKQYNFDIVFSLHRSARTSLMLYLSGIKERYGFSNSKLSFLYNHRVSPVKADHIVLRNLAIFSELSNFADIKPDMRLFTAPNDKINPEVLELIKGQPYAVIAPGSVWKTKRWRAEGYNAVVHYLINNGYRVILTGSKDEEAVGLKVAYGTGAINLIGNSPIAETLALTKHASLVVCNDSMMLHMASAFKVPTVAVFCATTESLGYGPWCNPRGIVVEKLGLPCKPCGMHGGSSCPKKHELCRYVEVEQVIAGIEKIFK